jgi:bloom syndrome protein
LLIEHPELELTDKELTRIDNIDNSDIGVINTASAPVLSSPSPPTIGPLTYAEALRVATKRATGFYPHAWQIAVAWAVYHGTCDALVVAGTGYGKTLPFILNLFLDSALIVWIVSPLNYIEMEQAKVFTNWGLRAIAVNSMTM